MDGDPRNELADLVLEVMQWAGSMRAVGVRYVPRDGGPGWPPLPTPAEPPPLPSRAGPPGPDATPQRRGGERQGEASSSPGDSGGKLTWAAYGRSVNRDQKMDLIREQVARCPGCGLERTRTKVVFGEGSPAARLVVVGEAPGEEEDATGRPFVGAAGAMLELMITRVIKVDRDAVFIMNVLKCRPPGNRDPRPEEVATCRQFLDAQLAVIRPEVILSLGRHATQALLGTTRGIKALRGRWQRYQGIPVMPTFHPAYLLRNAADKELALEDLWAVHRKLWELSGVGSGPSEEG